LPANVDDFLEAGAGGAFENVDAIEGVAGAEGFADGVDASQGQHGGPRRW